MANREKKNTDKTQAITRRKSLNQIELTKKVQKHLLLKVVHLLHSLLWLLMQEKGIG